MVTNSNFYRGVILAGLILLTGCAPPSFWRYGPDRQNLDEFEERVEKAFRLQNKMTSEIMALQDFDAEADNQAALSQAEQAMQKECSDLNDYAAREIDGRHKGLFLRHRVEHSVLACEMAAQRVQKLLLQQH